MKKIQELAIPVFIALIIVMIWEIHSVMTSQLLVFKGQSTVLSLFIVLLLPVVPVIYGRATSDQTGAIIIGIVPMFILGLLIRARSGDFSDGHLIVKGIGYWGTMMAVGGLAGYFAAKTELKSLVVSAILIVIWFAVFVSGLN
jgi:hypothetical protein